MNIGIIGGGAIARFLLKEINQNSNAALDVKSVYIRDETKYKHLSEMYGVELFTNIDSFLKSDINIIVEAANVKAVQELLPTILEKKDVVLISIGALSEESFFQEIYSQAEKYNRSIYLPSGAIGGLDLLQNAHSLEGVTEVSLTTRKPAKSLISEPIDNEIVIFKGAAKEAIKRFPKNINVSIILSLAGIGIDETKVTIIADPQVENNMHTINIVGEFGSATFSVTNNPMEENPKTSYLAALSILGTLRKLISRVKIGG